MFTTDSKLKARLKERQFPDEVSGKNLDPTTPDRLVNLYDGSIRWLDDAVQNLLQRLQTLSNFDELVLVVTGDHGQGLGQHDYIAHGTVWREQLHVPLFVKAPGVSPRRSDALLSTIDILPTALGQLADLPGQDFLDQCSGINVFAASTQPRPTFGMAPPRKNLHTITDGNWRYILKEDGEELYDPKTDPHELQDLSTKNPTKTTEMRNKLQSLMTAQKTRGEELSTGDLSDQEADLDPAFVEQLRALGYMDEGE
jgi:arylsulfatase A-like enzyme